MSQSRQYIPTAPPLTAAGSAPPSVPGSALANPTAGPVERPGTGRPGTGQPSTGQEGPDRTGARVSDTPRLLRRLTSRLILLGLAFGLAGVVSFAGLAYALDRAESDTQQLIRVQKIETSLLSADANATSAFLVGGLEPFAQRAAYDDAIASTGTLIAEASDAQPADAAALAALNRVVVDYAVSIEQARANNRQGFPVGAQYLRNASSTLRADALPLLDALVATNADRAEETMNSRVGWIFVVVGLLTLAGLTAAMVWVARRFKRRINTGLAWATGLVLVVWAVGSFVLIQAGRQVDEIRTGSFSSVNAAAATRIEANNAKANESLTLIARGSGAAFEKSWAASAAEVDRQLGALGQGDLSTAWRGYVTTHQEIRKLDDGGSWDAAVARATGAQATSSNATFGRFDASASRYLDSVSANTSEGLAAPQTRLVVFALLTFLAGLVAGLLARRGLAERLREYR